MTLRKLQEYLVRNRTFLFLPYYCVHSPIATNRIAMRFVVRSAPPFHYPADSSDNAKGGIWSGSQPQKTAGTFYPCLPFIVSIVYPIKPHCKAK